MAYFEWGDDLVVGNKLLDDDHRDLIGLVNELHTATSRGEGREVVGSILERLIDYTSSHFEREEAHMEKVGYPKLAQHRLQHEAMLKQARALQARFEEGNITVAAQVSALLRDWLSLHIRREDKAMARLLTTSDGS